MNLRRRIRLKSATNTSGCWVWMGWLDKDGYGSTRVDGKAIKAHRASYIAYHGEIPSEMCVCHKCDTPSCVNPDHLFLGSQLDNQTDKVNKRRQAKGLRHKASTHPETVKRGSNHFNTTLTEDDIIRIRRASKHGVGISDLAAAFGMSRSAMSDIIHNISWTHVTDS